MGASVVFHAVYVMTGAQRAAAEGGKKDSKSDDKDNDEDLSNGSSEEPEDHQQREDNSDEKNKDMFEQNKHINDKEHEEMPMRANNNEWKTDRIVHWEVNKTNKELQHEEGEALSTP